MHLPSHLTCASRSVGANQTPVCVLNGGTATTESLPVRLAPMRTWTRRPADAGINIQALVPSSSLIARKSVAGVAVGHSSFHSGLSLGRSLRLSNGSRWSAVWLDNTARVEADVPISVAWDLWSDREGISRWMPWIDSVKVLEDQPDLSRWTLKYNYFGQSWEFSWLSRNLKPTYHQKIHWRSVDGLPNRGIVRLYPRGPTSCAVQLTISYEVPEVLGGLGAVRSIPFQVIHCTDVGHVTGIYNMALAPVVESILQQDLDRFAKFAKGQQLESQRT